MRLEGGLLGWGVVLNWSVKDGRDVEMLSFWMVLRLLGFPEGMVCI